MTEAIDTTGHDHQEEDKYSERKKPSSTMTEMTGMVICYGQRDFVMQKEKTISRARDTF